MEQAAVQIDSFASVYRSVPLQPVAHRRKHPAQAYHQAGSRQFLHVQQPRSVIPRDDLLDSHSTDLPHLESIVSKREHHQSIL